MPRTLVDLFVFGNRSGPRRPRVGIDLFPDESGMLSTAEPAALHGASSFADPNRSGLTGHYHRLSAGTELPEGIEVVADGVDVIKDSEMPATHHTISPSKAMDADEFVSRFLSMPWEYAGKL